MRKQFASVKTSLPGPKAKEWLERRHSAVPDGVNDGTPAFVFIDFAGAIGVNNVGHSHDTVVNALQDQAPRYIHTGFNVMMYESSIELHYGADSG